MKWLALLPILLMVTPALALNITNSSIYCLDNTTLIENVTVYKDGNASNLWISTYCQFNCSNITESCNPPVYEQNIFTFVVVVGFIIALMLVYKFARSR